jgi:hypothetical protein
LGTHKNDIAAIKDLHGLGHGKRGRRRRAGADADLQPLTDQQRGAAASGRITTVA